MHTCSTVRQPNTDITYQHRRVEDQSKNIQGGVLAIQNGSSNHSVKKLTVELIVVFSYQYPYSMLHETEGIICKSLTHFEAEDVTIEGYSYTKKGSL